MSEDRTNNNRNNNNSNNSNNNSLYARLWSYFFPVDKFTTCDTRLDLIRLLHDFFLNNEAGKVVLNGIPLNFSHIHHFDMNLMKSCLPFGDFEAAVIDNPIEFNACLGLAISAIASQRSPYLEDPIIITSAFFNLSQNLSFGDIKADTVGRLVALDGHVVKVSPSTLMVEKGAFKCPKCMKVMMVSFVDGVYSPPQHCETPRCFNKMLIFDRSKAVTSVYQHIRLTEMSKSLDLSLEDSAARIPRSLDVEIRGHLVNTCMPGDIIKVVGVVRTLQVQLDRAARWATKGTSDGTGRRESGLHELYILANSITCMKGSGEKETAIFSISLQHSSFKGYLLTNEHNLLVDKDTTGLRDDNNPDFSRSELIEIRELALSNQAMEILVHNLCPIIYGHELVKFGLILGLFGGSDYPADETSSKDFKVRTNIHILVVGDPGMGKVNSHVKVYILFISL